MRIIVLMPTLEIFLAGMRSKTQQYSVITSGIISLSFLVTKSIYVTLRAKDAMESFKRASLLPNRLGWVPSSKSNVLEGYYLSKRLFTIYF